MVDYNDLPADLKAKMEEEGNNVLVLTTPPNVPCFKCKATVRELAKRNIPFTTSATLDNEEHLDFFVKANGGGRVAPGVIVVNNEKQIVEAWGDFRDSKIAELEEKYSLCAA